MEQLSSYKVERIFVDAIKELIETIQDDMTILDDFNEGRYRNMIQELVMEKSEYLQLMFKDEKWATWIDSGSVVPILSLNGTIENIYKRAMAQFNEENQDLIHVFKAWEEKHANFRMVAVYAEEYMSEEEYQGYETKFKDLIGRFAKRRGLTRFRAKMQLPPFDSLIDKVEWLEDELDGEDTLEVVKDVKIDEEAIERGEAQENPKFAGNGGL